MFEPRSPLGLRTGSSSMVDALPASNEGVKRFLFVFLLTVQHPADSLIPLAFLSRHALFLQEVVLFIFRSLPIFIDIRCQR